jgi:hypothetical protein
MGVMEPSTPPEAPAPRRRRRTLWIGALAVLLIVVCGPMAALPFVEAQMVADWNRAVDGEVRVEELSLNPFGRPGLRGLRWTDPEGRPVLSVDRAWADAGWTDLLTGSFHGELEVAGLEMHLRPEKAAEFHLPQPEDVHLAPAGQGLHLHPMPEVSGAVHVSDSRLVLHHADGGLQVLDLELSAHLGGLDRPAPFEGVVGLLDAAGAQGVAAFAGTLTLADEHRLDASTVHGRLRIQVADLDLDALRRWFREDPLPDAGHGVVAGEIRLSREPGGAWLVESELAPPAGG